MKTLKLILCTVLSLMIALTAWCSASAENGAKNSFDIEPISSTQAKLVGYKGNEAEITVPNEIKGYKITEIGYGAFENNTSVKKVYVNSLVKKVSDYAFSGCTSLEKAVLSNIKGIGYAAFKGCERLEKAVISESTSFISSNSFEGCEKLTICTETNSYACNYAVSKGFGLDLFGDLDSNGNAEIYDVLYLQNIIAKKSALTQAQFEEADVDMDGEITVKDILKLQGFLANKSKMCENTLCGKTGVFFGDSICAGTNNKTGGWASYIEKQCEDFTAVNYGINGATFLSSFNEYFADEEKVSSLCLNTDYVIIEGFTNGMYQNPPKKPVGTINMNDYTVTADNCNTDTYSGEMEKYILKCIELYGRDKLGFIISFKSFYHFEQDSPYVQFVSQMINCCKKYKIPLINLQEEVNIPCETQAQIDEYYCIRSGKIHGDKVHLNAKGNSIISQKIMQWMKTL